MLEDLKVLLANTTQEEFDKDWEEILKLGLGGITFEEFEEFCDNQKLVTVDKK